MNWRWTIIGMGFWILGGAIYIPTGDWPGLVIGICGAFIFASSLKEDKDG